MKKLAFAIQVFSLIAMFPVYVVAEFNHGTGRFPNNTSSKGIIKEPAKMNTKSTLTTAEENSDVVLLMPGINRY